MNGLHHIAGEHFAAPYGGQNVFERLTRQTRERCLQGLFGIRPSGALEGARDDLFAKARILRPHGIARGAANGGPRLAGNHK